ncbi:transcriptional regulator [Sorangium sp. So ce726]|uniref:transcriptional regulator n=1 Tax=Sorangium sp. So ce726 TaxID=3133319 RepID=UPI003F5FD9BC
MSTLRLALQMVLGIALPFALQRWDRRRLTPEQRAACWNGATWGAALYAFGPLSMLGWCWVTRGVQHGRPGARGSGPNVSRSVWHPYRARAVGARGSERFRALKALGLGAASAAALVLILSGVDYLFALALGLPP